MTVWCVVVDGLGAHEPQAILSIWSTEAGADAEVQRLNAQHQPTYYDHSYCFVVSAEADVPSEEWIA